MDSRIFKNRLHWTIGASSLQTLIDSCMKFPLLTKIYQLSPTATSSGLKHGDLLWVDGLVSDKRLLCKTSRTENEHESYLDLASVPVEFNERPIEVLPEESLTFCTVKALAIDRPLQGLWLKPIHSDVPHLIDEAVVKLEGEAYRKNKSERLVLRGLSGRVYFLEQDSESEFQVLRHCGPIDLRVAINMFSIPLHFQFLLEASDQNKDLKDYETNFEVIRKNYFSEATEETLPVEEVFKPCSALSFITLQYLQCFKVDPQTGKPSSQPIYLPSFAFDTTVLLMKNWHDIVQVMGHDKYTLATRHKRYSTPTSDWILSHRVTKPDEVTTHTWSKLKLKDTNDNSFCRIESINIYE